MTFPLLVAGLILWLAGSSWFAGAQTVGIILTVVGALGLLVQVGLVGGFLAKIFKEI